MIVRLGYVAISLAVNATTSSPYTYSEYLKNNDLNKLDTVIKSNLINLEKIIDYNIRNNINFYRLSSKLIPLATKDEIEFDYITPYRLFYNKIGNKIKDNHIRVDFHPDQFTVLNSTNSQIVNNTIKTLKYHYNLLDALKIKNKLMIIHVGSSVLGKKNSITRFINNFKKLPSYLQKSIAIENDDKIFNIEDCIQISKELNIPIVLDYHHYNCNKSILDIPTIFDSWKNIIPKIHFSSPKNIREFRNHNDYINCDDFIAFINIIKDFGKDVDIMLEAKAKDDAMFRLIRELKYKTNYKFIDDTTFEVK